MNYLLVLHEALDDNLVDEINATGAHLSKKLATDKGYFGDPQIFDLGIRLNDNFCQVGYANMRFYRNDGSHYISGYTEINLDQFLKLLGIKEPEPFEDELMKLLGG